MRAEELLIITLHEHEEKSLREIVGLTGWSESNLRVRAFRARRALKTILEKNDEREFGQKARQLVCGGKVSQA